VGRGEFQLQVESRQRVVQGLDRARGIHVERPYGIQPAALQIEANRVRCGEPAQLRQVVRWRRLEHPQYERHRVVSYGYFDLRNPLPDCKTIQHQGERLDQSIERLRKYLATADLGHIGRQALTKTNDNTVFLRDELRAEPGTAAIIPNRSPQW